MKSTNKFRAFLKMMLKPGRASRSDLLKYLPAWRASLGEGRNPLDDRRPWIAFAAADYLESVLTKDMSVYEFGSGGSTLFFSDRVRNVVSTEHDKEWHAIVEKKLQSAGVKNSEVRLFEAEPGADGVASPGGEGDPKNYSSGAPEFSGMSFKAYASSIDEYPDAHFDVIVIDGRARPSCFLHAESKLKPGGYLVLDNAERPYLSYIHEAAETNGWKKFDHFGLFPYISHCSQTCIWQKTA